MVGWHVLVSWLEVLSLILVMWWMKCEGWWTLKKRKKRGRGILTKEYGRWCLPEEFIFERCWSIYEKEDGKLVVYIRWMNFSGRLTAICILQIPELIQSPFMVNVCCPSEEFIIATASSCSWQVGVHTLHFKHNNSLSGELFWEQVNLHTNNKKGNCMHHWDTGK